MNKSYSKLPIKIDINVSTKSYSRNQSSKNIKTITDYSIKNKEKDDINKNNNKKKKNKKEEEKIVEENKKNEMIEKVMKI